MKQKYLEKKINLRQNIVLFVNDKKNKSSGKPEDSELKYRKIQKHLCASSEKDKKGLNIWETSTQVDSLTSKDSGKLRTLSLKIKT